MSPTVCRLVALARQEFKSDAAIARAMRVSRQRLADWKAARLPIPPGRLAHLASLARVGDQAAIGCYAVERFRQATRPPRAMRRKRTRPSLGKIVRKP